MTGFGATASRLGQPDIGLLTQTEMTTHARDMTRAVDIPVIADADTGYGGPSNIERTVREYVQAGVAAIHLEDQVAPEALRPDGRHPADGRARERTPAALRAAGARRRPAAGHRPHRCAAGGRHRRGGRAAQRYRDAGVDLVFVDGIKTVAEVEAVARRVAGPKVVSIVDGTEAVALTRSRSAGHGLRGRVPCGDGAVHRRAGRRAGAAALRTPARRAAPTARHELRRVLRRCRPRPAPAPRRAWGASS